MLRPHDAPLERLMSQVGGYKHLTAPRSRPSALACDIYVGRTRSLRLAVLRAAECFAFQNITSPNGNP
jgi:hypothetical protein